MMLTRYGTIWHCSFAITDSTLTLHDAMSYVSHILFHLSPLSIRMCMYAFAPSIKTVWTQSAMKNHKLLTHTMSLSKMVQ